MSVYQDVTNLCKPYLGPATEQFIARQCRSHLQIEPEALTKPRLAELAKWVEVGGALVMDAAKSKELAAKVAGC